LELKKTPDNGLAGAHLVNPLSTTQAGWMVQILQAVHPGYSPLTQGNFAAA
jgi:hypothetical protein